MMRSKMALTAWTPFNGFWVSNSRVRRSLEIPCCRLNRNLWFGSWCELSCEAELGDLAGEALCLVLRRGAVEVIGAEVCVEGAVVEHVVGGSQDGGGHCANGLFWSAAVAQALELGLQVAGLLAAGCPGALHQGGLWAGSCGGSGGRRAVIRRLREGVAGSAASNPPG